MIKRALIQTLLLTFSLFLLSFHINAQTAPVKIMPVGDSITELSSSYRYDLYCKLRAAGFNINFVGSHVYSSDNANRPSNCIVNGTNLGIAWDKDQAGHSGTFTSYVASNIRSWTQSQQPDIILIHIGTNEVLGSPYTRLYKDQWGNSGMYEELSKAIDEARAVKSNVKIVLAKIIPIRSDIESSKEVKVAGVNAVVERVFQEKNTISASPLYLVDMTAAGINPSDSGDLYDGIHTANQGGLKMANKWYPTVQAILNNQSFPVVIPTATPTAKPTTAPTAKPTVTVFRTPTPTNKMTLTPVPSAVPLTKIPTPQVTSQYIQRFYKGFNINGGSVFIGQNKWLAGSTPGLTVKGRFFTNNSVALIPSTDANRTAMIRSSAWGNNATPLSISLSAVPGGLYDIYLYNWEDNATAQFSILVEGQQVATNVKSGAKGTWKRLGPYRVNVRDTQLNLRFTGGDANISGLELYKLESAATPMTVR